MAKKKRPKKYATKSSPLKEEVEFDDLIRVSLQTPIKKKKSPKAGQADSKKK